VKHYSEFSETGAKVKSMKKAYFNHSRHRLWFFTVLIILAIVIGCSTNPATKRRELMLVSEDKEFGIGRQVDKTVREEMGIYLELPELRSAIKAMVDNLGQNSDRPTLIYRVEIIDTPDFNAFAVPGGFLYPNVAKTRGLQRQGIKGEDVVIYFETLITPHLESSCFPNGLKNMTE
jgi:Zn-dependent protease with chaperone function